jgi:hypothetical protein
MDENKAEAAALASMTADKHTRKMAEHAQLMAELEIKKQQMDIEANRKLLQAEDRRIAAQHQREREKKQHEMQMLHLCLQYQGGSGVAGIAQPTAPATQFGMEGFANPGAFGGMGMGMNGNYLT